MQDIGIVQQDSTVRIMFVTRNGSGAAVAPSSAFENADVEIYKDGSATQRTSDAGITMTSPFDTVTGLHLVAIDLSDDTDAGFWAAGSTYHVTIQPDETVDSQTVVEILAKFSIESDAERSQRLYRTYLYPSSTVSTVTGNTTTQINFTDIIDAQTPADAIVGRIYSVRDATDGGIEDVVATAFTYPNATVERLSNAGAMSFTVAAGDDVWPVGFVDVEMRGRLTDTRAGYLDDLVLSSELPTNFSAFAITTAGTVTAGTVSDKTGYSLAVTGLDAVTLSEPGGVPVWGTVTAREGLAWNVAFNRNKIISNSTEITLRNDADGADIAAAPVTATTSSVTRGEYA